MKKTTIEIHPAAIRVPGYVAFEMHGYRFIVHRKINSDYDVQAYGKRKVGNTWVVAEESSGCAVLHDFPTRSEAVFRIREHLETRTQKQITDAVNRKLVERAKKLLEM